jgi:opacity protein-like surface antigen
MARLPQPGGDAGNWGEILNDFLRETLESDGSHKPIPQATIQNLSSDLDAKANVADLGTAATANVDDFAAKSVQESVETGRLSETQLEEKIGVEIERFDIASTDRRYAEHILSHVGLLSDPNPPVMNSPPTVTHASTTTLTKVWSAAAWVNDNPFVTLHGRRGTWDGTYGRLQVGPGYTVLDFFVTDTEFALHWVEQVANGSRIWIWIDGQPVASPPTTAPMVTAAGAGYYTGINWGTRARRRVTIHLTTVLGYYAIRTNQGGHIEAAGEPPRVAFVGDSFYGGSSPSPTMRSMVGVAARALRVNALNNGVGGTGWKASATPFGQPARVAQTAAFKPDLIVFSGSVNDSGQSGLGTAVTDTLNAYAEACPRVPIIVFGIQPTSATTTISLSMATANNQILTAAAAHPSVIRTFDMVGHGDGVVPPEATISTQYVTGQKVRRQGAIYAFANPNGSNGPALPGASPIWTPLTWAYSGTGNVGATTGDGSRDFLLGAIDDTTHPSLEGAEALGLMQARSVVQALREFVA